jgi:hypothetical protein
VNPGGGALHMLGSGIAAVIPVSRRPRKARDKNYLHCRTWDWDWDWVGLGLPSCLYCYCHCYYFFLFPLPAPRRGAAPKKFQKKATTPHTTQHTTTPVTGHVSCFVSWPLSPIAHIPRIYSLERHTAQRQRQHTPSSPAHMR